MKCEDITIDALLKRLEHTLYETLEADWKAWDKQLEEDIKAGCVKFLALTDIFIVRGQLTCFWPIPNRSRFGDRSDRFSVHILPNTLHTKAGKLDKISE